MQWLFLLAGLLLILQVIPGSVQLLVCYHYQNQYTFLEQEHHIL